MGVVMIMCPETRRAISTGLAADHDSYGRTPVFFARTFCPFCRTSHEWFAKQAWVRETEIDAGRRPARRVPANRTNGRICNVAN